MSSLQCQAAQQWRNATGEDTILGTENASDIDTVLYDNTISPLDSLLSRYRDGCNITYVSAASISVGLGELCLANADGSIRLFAKNTAATTVTFANIDTGAEAASTTYYVWAVLSAATDTTFTVKLSTSSTVPTGSTYYRRLGTIYNNSSSNIDASKITNDNNYYALKLGDWTAKSANTTYQATTDGFAVGYTLGGAAGYRITAYTDSSTPPTTVRMTNSDSSGAGVYAGACIPVKKGDYYKIDYNAGGTTGTATFFIPME